MCNRFFYIFRMLIKKRVCLKAVLSNSDNFVHCIRELSCHYLMQYRIKLLVLDFDGVLSSHGKTRLTGSVSLWLTQLSNDFPLKQICIHSNNLFDSRIQYLENAFPDIEIIYFTQKKPYPHDLLNIVQRRKLKPQDILVVDDRLTSGILCACLIGARGLLITKPFIDYRAATIKEFFFTFVRFIERKTIKSL